MDKIQNKLDELQPYVVSIRYVNEKLVVDVIFKENWVFLDDNNIVKTKGESEYNYFMIYGLNETIDIDYIFRYIKLSITSNIEREKKNDLLATKVEELKKLFINNSLEKIKTLKFVFDEIHVNQDMLILPIEQPVLDVVTISEKDDVLVENSVEEFKDNLTDEEKEILEEEERGKRNNEYLKRTKKNIELPPKN